ncbi:MAG: SMP-30/gluconolactonase/LRE family protein [Burkholderiales bacterium]
MKKTLKGVGFVVVLLVGYLLFWPVAVQPGSWDAPVAPGYVGAHAANTRLAHLQMIELHGDQGPEHIAFGPDGRLYTGVASGNILRMQPDGSELEVFVNTGGRTLGLDFDASGNLIAADALKGLLSIAPDRKITVLVDRMDNVPLLFPDAVIVAKDGKIYFSDASMHFAPKDWGGTFEASVMDLMEGAATGRILVYDPASKATTVMARGLSFANGVALSQDQQSLYVNETGKFRVWKIATAARELDLSQSNPPTQATVFMDNLPGYPDNLMRAKDGKIWLGLAAPRNPDADRLSNQPWLRKVVLRLPRALWPIPKPYGHVFAFTEDGKIVADLQDPSGIYPTTTSITESGTRLYVQSLEAKGVGWMAR